MPSVLGESALGPMRSVPRDGDGDGQIFDGTPKQQSVPRAPALPQHQATELRAFGDSGAIRARILDRVREAASAIPPVTNQRHTLTLEDVGYEGATKHSIDDWKKAIMGGRSLGSRLRGTWVLRDNDTGAVVDRKRSTVATVPYLTDHGTFIQNGSEYTLSHQLRLRPGVFTRVQANGELEAHVNVMPGKGASHRIFMEPETGVFRLKVGQSKMPLTSVLRAMGASDTQLRNAWGDLYGANMLKDDPSVIGKLHERLVRKPDPNKTQEQEVRESFERMGLDPEVTKRTLGKPYDKVSLDQMLDTTKKLVAISHGQVEPDDRDHLAYMTAMGPEDLLAERVGKDRMLLGKTLWKASMTGSLKHVQPELLTRGINAAIMSSGLGQPTEGINPAMIFDQQTRVSRLGVGGIPSLDAIPAEARNVQPSHFGLIDPLVTPECFDALTYTLTDRGWKQWPDVTTADRLACRVDGRVVFEYPVRVIGRHYHGPMIGLQSRAIDYLVTPNHRILNATPKRRDSWRIDAADSVYGRRRIFDVKLRAVVRPDGPDVFRIPAPPMLTTRGKLPAGDIVVPMPAWCRFMAWYIAEGWQGIKVRPKGKGSEYRVTIAQSDTANPQKCKRIAAVLDALSWRWHYEAKSKAFVINSKHLTYYLARYGRSANKYLPRYFYDRPLDERRELLEILMMGDGDESYRYVTSSYRLSLDVHELACEAGYSATINPMDSPSHIVNHREKPRWRVNVARPGRDTVGCVEPSVYAARDIGKRGHYREAYDGEVYCAEVPGGLLYVMRNGKSHWSGNSLHVGVDGRVAQATLKGDDGRLYSPFRNVKTGRMEHKSAQDLADATIAFPGELKTLKPYVSALVGGKIRDVPRNQVQYELPSMDDAFSAVSNLVPMKSTVKGQREVMAGRMMTQALPVRDPQAPLVQAGIKGSNDDSYESRYGRKMGALHSDVGGIVQHVDKDKGKITVKGDDGRMHEHDLYINYPYNRKTYIHQTPVVGPGRPRSSWCPAGPVQLHRRQGGHRPGPERPRGLRPVPGAELRGRGRRQRVDGQADVLGAHVPARGQLRGRRQAGQEGPRLQLPGQVRPQRSRYHRRRRSGQAGHDRHARQPADPGGQAA